MDGPSRVFSVQTCVELVIEDWYWVLTLTSNADN